MQYKIENNMNEEQRVAVREYVAMVLCGVFTDPRDLDNVTDTILDEVITDIEETADINFNGSDVRIAIVRVLKKKIGIYDEIK